MVVNITASLGAAHANEIYFVECNLEQLTSNVCLINLQLKCL